MSFECFWSVCLSVNHGCASFLRIWDFGIFDDNTDSESIAGEALLPEYVDEADIFWDVV